MCNRTDYFRTKELSQEEVEGRICTCPENPNANDDSWLPCMSMEQLFCGGEEELTCNKCIFCNEY